MIILAVGMPRAGSGWHYNLVHDLIVANGGDDAREIRKRFLLNPILTEVNCNIGALTTHRVLPLLIPSALNKTFTIKAHGGPKPFANWLIKNDELRATYIYRDPRAALLSAFEYGQRGLQQGRMTAFGHLDTIDKAIDFMRDYVAIWREWMALEDVLHIRYEDMLTGYEWEIPRLTRFMEINEGQAAVKQVIEKYRPGQIPGDQKGMHYYMGEAERFRDVLNSPQLRRCEQEFGAELRDMGYTI
jgi:hypothetical protein